MAARIAPSFRLLLACLFLYTALPARAADWPMTAHDAQRTGGTADELPSGLRPAWAMQLPPLKPAWPDQPRETNDAVYHPLVIGNRLIIASPLDDSVAVYDVAGRGELWRFFTGGPIRYAPASADGRLFVGSDDGWLYALSLDDGSLLWKRKGAPRARAVLGNGRMIDTWPIRGGPVTADGKVYFAAGIWPFMGVFVNCLEATTGKTIWCNSGEGDDFINQPHGAPSFAGIAPQGSLAVSGDKLLIPNGRAVPACFDRNTGKFLYFKIENRSGGDRVVAAGDLFFNDGIGFALDSGKPLASSPVAMALDNDSALGITPSGIIAFDLTTPIPTTAPTFAKLTIGPRQSFQQQAVVAAPDGASVIRAGRRAYVGGKDFVAAYRLPLRDGQHEAWYAAVDGTVAEMAAGADRLFAVTREGRIYCFGGGSAADSLPGSVVRVPGNEAPVPLSDYAKTAVSRIDKNRDLDGYCVAIGAASEALARAIAKDGNHHVVIVEPDVQSVEQLRRRLQHDGMYGDRIAVIAGDLSEKSLPPYFAGVVVAEDPSPLRANPAWADSVFRLLHPYHGRAYFPRERLGDAGTDELLARSAGHFAVETSADLVRLARVGGLPGAGNWTHEHADAGNSRVSHDSLVKAPLGVLWFGGSSNDGILPRHGHGPQPQVIDGRVIVEGVDMLRALDIYSGRVLWESSLPGVGSYYNITTHQPGANGTGTNYVSTSDGIYVAVGRTCTRLDPATGRAVSAFPLPAELIDGPETMWGYLNVWGNYLVGGSAAPSKSPPPRVPLISDDLGEDTHPNSAPRSIATSPRAFSSRALFVMDRHSGRLLWTVRAKSEFRHNAVCIGNGRLYAIDRPPGKVALPATAPSDPGTQPADVANKPAVPKSDATRAGSLLAFALESGREVWRDSDAVFGTWLSYSAAHDVLVESGRSNRDSLGDEARGMRAYAGADGKVLWFDPTAFGPAMIRDNEVLKDRSAADLLTGRPVTQLDALTGIEREWTWMRMYGCNTPAVAENIMTFRSGAAGFYDLARSGGTGNFGGFRSSCTNNLIVAGGLLVAPDYTRTCTCSYQIQTSLALVPDPEAEMWTFLGAGAEVKGRIKRLGVNLGAAGDRVSDDGTLWLESPSTGGQSPKIEVTVTGDKVEYFRRHASVITGEMPWVTSSGVRGARTVTVSLNDPGEAQPYTVRLYFAQPPESATSASPMDVRLQAQSVEQRLDVLKEAGGIDRSLVREYHHIFCGPDLTVELTPTTPQGVSLLCGVELIAEDGSEKK
ncbi:MAG: outer rane biosis protein [Phycisphaerales bacterium]|nr:outer rane biosis protein [Phycisphaerales bacterium]